MCVPETPAGPCVRHWSRSQISRAVQQLSPLGVAACQPLPSPYQAVQDMIFSGHDQLAGTYYASVAEARAQLLALETTMRGQLYASYVEQCLAMSPEFRERGRRVGARILAQLLAAPAVSRLSQVSYSDVAAAKASGPPSMQLDWLHGNGSISGSVNGSSTSGSYDSALAILDGLAQPLLDPFVEGLKEPFVQAVRDYQAKTQSVVTIAAAGKLVGGIAAGAVLGFFIGRFAGGGGGGNGKK